jgi:predicted nucleic acid-binding protein
MILLDTNYLITSLVPKSLEAQQVKDWIRKGQELCTSGICWYEFLCGPVEDEGILLVSFLIRELVLPFTADQAKEASRLFNETGRKRHLRVDAMIAAAAIVSNAILATDNQDDFGEFLPYGLKLLS